MRLSFLMQRPIRSLLIIFPLLLAPLHVGAKQTAEDVIETSNSWWSTGGTASQDGAFTAVSSSLIGWGVGGIVAIAIVTALFGSESGSSSSHSH